MLSQLRPLAVAALVLCVLPVTAGTLSAASTMLKKGTKYAGPVADWITIAIFGVEGGKLAKDYFDDLRTVMKGKDFGADTFTSLTKGFSPNLEQLSAEVAKSGERGLLLDVVIFQKENAKGGLDYVLVSVMPNGFGGSPDDAAFKALASEDRIYADGLLTAVSARQQLPDDSYAVSDLSFGIWLKRNPDGQLVAESVPGYIGYASKAGLKWKLHKNSLLNARVADSLNHLKEVDDIYDKLASDYDASARQRGLIGQLNMLKGAQQDAAIKLRNAEKTLQDAYDRQDKYSGFKNVSSILGLGATVVQGWGDMAAKEAAKTGYNESVVKSHTTTVTNTRTDVNNFFINNFNVKQASLPEATPKTNLKVERIIP